MKNSVVIAFAMIMTLLPSTVMAYGEGEDIPMDARAIHLLTNEARTNTREALALCGDNCSETIECYAETLPPLYWDDGLYKAAQFHANMLSYITCMQHDSPCTLVVRLRVIFLIRATAIRHVLASKSLRRVVVWERRHIPVFKCLLLSLIVKILPLPLALSGVLNFGYMKMAMAADVNLHPIMDIVGISFRVQANSLVSVMHPILLHKTLV